MRMFLLGLLCAASVLSVVRTRSTAHSTGTIRELDAASARESSLRRDADNLDRNLTACTSRLAAILSELNYASIRLRHAEAECKAAASAANRASVVRDTVQAELLACQDRLERAFKEVLGLEGRIAQLDRECVFLREKLDEHGIPVFPAREYRTELVEGTVVGSSLRTNLVLLSVGSDSRVTVGTVFRVVRGDQCIGHLIVDRVEKTWSSARRVFQRTENKLLGYEIEEDVHEGDMVESLSPD